MYYLNHYFIEIIALVLIDLILRGIAMWKAARNNQQYWYIALLVLNTIGILPVIYILFFQKDTS